jgi:type IV secretory pathway VirB6-like protein
VKNVARHGVAVLGSGKFYWMVPVNQLSHDGVSAEPPVTDPIGRLGFQTFERYFDIMNKLLAALIAAAFATTGAFAADAKKEEKKMEAKPAAAAASGQAMKADNMEKKDMKAEAKAEKKEEKKDMKAEAKTEKKEEAKK